MGEESDSLHAGTTSTVIAQAEMVMTAQEAGECHHRDLGKRGSHRDHGHEEDILQADGETKKEVTIYQAPVIMSADISLKHHRRDSGPEGTGTESRAQMSARGAETTLLDGLRPMT